MAEPRSQYSVGGNFSHKDWEGGLVQGEGRHEEKVKVLLFHMANKPRATVVARKLSARTHRTRRVMGIMSVGLLFVFLLSCPGAGPRSNMVKKKKAGEKRLRQEAATLALPSPRADLAGVVKGRRRKPRAHLGWGKQWQQVLLSWGR